MKKYCHFIFIIIFSLVCYNLVMASDKKVHWKWNQTNKVMPKCVKDSICNFYKRHGREGYPFTMWGTGVSIDNKDIDGIYQFRLFVTHQPVHLMIIHQRRIYIMESISVSGIIAEMCRFIDENELFEKFRQETYNVFYNTMLEQYEGYKVENGRYISMCFDNETEKISYMWSRSRRELVLQLSSKMLKDASSIRYFPYYILTDNLNEEECILILGIIANNGDSGLWGQAPDQ